ncbi:hypothetical protein ACA758_01955 [Mycoplasmopsis agassizii]|uniref:hypothetical protein n=1 Tax=Mycoplasmopsis agassizii TaxID=33922 RepID=UPI003527F474
MKLKTKILLSSLFLASTLSATAFVACSFNRITNLAEIQKTDLGYEIILIGDSNWSFRGEYAYGIRGLSDDSYGDWIQNQTIRSEKQKAISFLKDVTDLEKVLGETKNEKDEWSSNKNERAKWTELRSKAKVEYEGTSHEKIFIVHIKIANYPKIIKRG